MASQSSNRNGTRVMLRNDRSMPAWVTDQSGRIGPKPPPPPLTPENGHATQSAQPQLPPKTKTQPEPDYEVIEFSNQQYSNAPLRPSSASSGSKTPDSKLKCTLCGSNTPWVTCDECAQQIFCASCDDMYHKHPKRKTHHRKTLEQSIPPLPPKVQPGQSGPAPPVAPPRRNKRGFMTPLLQRRDQVNDTRGSVAIPPSPTPSMRNGSWLDRAETLKRSSSMLNRPLPETPKTGSTPSESSRCGTPKSVFDTIQRPPSVVLEKIKSKANATLDRMQHLQQRYRQQKEQIERDRSGSALDQRQLALQHHQMASQRANQLGQRGMSSSVFNLNQLHRKPSVNSNGWMNNHMHQAQSMAQLNCMNCQQQPQAAWGPPQSMHMPSSDPWNSQLSSQQQLNRSNLSLNIGPGFMMQAGHTGMYPPPVFMNQRGVMGQMYPQPYMGGMPVMNPGLSGMPPSASRNLSRAGSRIASPAMSRKSVTLRRKQRSSYREDDGTDDEDSDEDDRRSIISTRSGMSRTRQRRMSSASQFQQEDELDIGSSKVQRSRLRSQRRDSIAKSVHNDWAPGRKESTNNNRSADSGFNSPLKPSRIYSDLDSEGSGTRALVQAKIEQKLKEDTINRKKQIKDKRRSETPPKDIAAPAASNPDSQRDSNIQTASEEEYEVVEEEVTDDDVEETIQQNPTSEAPTTNGFTTEQLTVPASDEDATSLGPPPSTPDQEWECEFCTFVNEPNIKICSICCKTPSKPPKLVEKSGSPPKSTKAQPSVSAESKKQDYSSDTGSKTLTRNVSSKAIVNGIAAGPGDTNTTATTSTGSANKKDTALDVWAALDEDIQAAAHEVTRKAEAAHKPTKVSTGCGTSSKSASVERQELESQRSQAREIGTSPPPQTISTQDADLLKYTTEELNAALKYCGPDMHPLVWLRDNWPKLIQTVQSLATKYGQERAENTIGTISQMEAREALRMHSGNVWQAVSECIEQRQRKYKDISSKGNFSREDVVTALTTHHGNLEMALMDLGRTQLKPFLMRIWGSPGGVENESGALAMSDTPPPNHATPLTMDKDIHIFLSANASDCMQTPLAAAAFAPTNQMPSPFDPPASLSFHDTHNHMPDNTSTYSADSKDYAPSPLVVDDAILNNKSVLKDLENLIGTMEQNQQRQNEQVLRSIQAMISNLKQNKPEDEFDSETLRILTKSPIATPKAKHSPGDNTSKNDEDVKSFVWQHIQEIVPDLVQQVEMELLEDHDKAPLSPQTEAQPPKDLPPPPPPIDQDEFLMEEVIKPNLKNASIREELPPPYSYAAEIATFQMTFDKGLQRQHNQEYKLESLRNAMREVFKMYTAPAVAQAANVNSSPRSTPSDHIPATVGTLSVTPEPRSSSSPIIPLTINDVFGHPVDEGLNKSCGSTQDTTAMDQLTSNVVSESVTPMNAELQQTASITTQLGESALSSAITGIDLPNEKTLPPVAPNVNSNANVTNDEDVTVVTAYTSTSKNIVSLNSNTKPADNNIVSETEPTADGAAAEVSSINLMKTKTVDISIGTINRKHMSVREIAISRGHSSAEPPQDELIHKSEDASEQASRDKTNAIQAITELPSSPLDSISEDIQDLPLPRISKGTDVSETESKTASVFEDAAQPSVEHNLKPSSAAEMAHEHLESVSLKSTIPSVTETDYTPTELQSTLPPKVAPDANLPKTDSKLEQNVPENSEVHQELPLTSASSTSLESVSPKNTIPSATETDYIPTELQSTLSPKVAPDANLPKTDSKLEQNVPENSGVHKELPLTSASSTSHSSSTETISAKVLDDRSKINGNMQSLQATDILNSVQRKTSKIPVRRTGSNKSLILPPTAQDKSVEAHKLSDRIKSSAPADKKEESKHNENLQQTDVSLRSNPESDDEDELYSLAGDSPTDYGSRTDEVQSPTSTNEVFLMIRHDGDESTVDESTIIPSTSSSSVLSATSLSSDLKTPAEFVPSGDPSKQNLSDLVKDTQRLIQQMKEEINIEDFESSEDDYTDEYTDEYDDDDDDDYDYDDDDDDEKDEDDDEADDDEEQEVEDEEEEFYEEEEHGEYSKEKINELKDVAASPIEIKAEIESEQAADKHEQNMDEVFPELDTSGLGESPSQMLSLSHDHNQIHEISATESASFPPITILRDTSMVYVESENRVPELPLDIVEIKGVNPSSLPYMDARPTSSQAPEGAALENNENTNQDVARGATYIEGATQSHQDVDGHTSVSQASEVTAMERKENTHRKVATGTFIEESSKSNQTSNKIDAMPLALVSAVETENALPELPTEVAIIPLTQVLPIQTENIIAEFPADVVNPPMESRQVMETVTTVLRTVDDHSLIDVHTQMKLPHSDAHITESNQYDLPSTSKNTSADSKVLQTKAQSESKAQFVASSKKDSGSAGTTAKKSTSASKIPKPKEVIKDTKTKDTVKTGSSVVRSDAKGKAAATTKLPSELKRKVPTRSKSFSGPPTPIGITSVKSITQKYLSQTKPQSNQTQSAKAPTTVTRKPSITEAINKLTKPTSSTESPSTSSLFRTRTQPRIPKKKYHETCFSDDDYETTSTEEESEPLEIRQRKMSIPVFRAYPSIQEPEEIKTEELVEKFMKEGLANTIAEAQIAAALVSMKFQQDVSLWAAKECSDLDHAVALLRQECELCSGTYALNQIVSMLKCTHKCCKQCAKTYFTVQITERSINDCNCPFCKQPELNNQTEHEDENLEYFSNLDIYLKNIVEPDVHELFQRKLRDRTLLKDPNFKWCVQCSSGFFARPKQKRLICPDCGSVTCAFCRKPWQKQHEGISCEKFLEWEAANDPQVQDQGVKQHLEQNGIDCPKCKFRYSLARGGCMHFTCTQCKFEFCYGCARPFHMGAKCNISPYCAKLGLHAHHPRNCLFYLRDKLPMQLQILLKNNNVPFEVEPTDLATSDGEPGTSQKKVALCPIPIQKETPTGLVDTKCGGDVPDNHAGMCRTHYVEYLTAKVAKANIDPLPIFDLTDCVQELRRRGIPLPERGPWDTDEIYKGMCAEVITKNIPLNAH